MKALVLLFGMLISGTGLYQSIGPGLCSSNASSALITFSWNSSTHLLTMTGNGYCVGKGIFYNVGTESPTIASTHYTAPFTSSSGTVYTAMCATVGSVQQNIDLSSTNWKVCTAVGASPNPGYNNGTPVSTCGGGVGTNQPSTWTMVWNAFVMSVSTTSSSGQTAILVPYGNNTTVCDSCTELVVRKTVSAVNTAGIGENESDIYQYDNTHSKEHMGGFQCNQVSGKWQYDNVGGSGWQNFSPTVTDHCPWPESAPFLFEAAIHWIIGDTGCGGLGCIYYDYIRINGTQYNCVSCVLEAATTSFAAFGTQEQIGMLASSSSTVGRTISGENVSLGKQDESANVGFTIP